MPQPRPGKKSAGRPKGDTDTRNRLLKAAEVLLVERGYAGLSLQEVARRVGVTKATLFHHFPGGKDELVLAVAHALLERHHQGMVQVMAKTQGARDKLLVLTRWGLSNEWKTGVTVRDATSFVGRGPAGELKKAFMASQYEPVKAVFDLGVQQGEFRPHDTSFTTWAFLGLVAELVMSSELEAIPDLAERIVTLLIDGVGQPARPH